MGGSERAVTGDLDNVLAVILGAPPCESPDALDAKADALEGDAAVLRGTAARLRRRAGAVREQAIALQSVAAVEGAAAAATVALNEALAEAVACHAYAQRALKVLLGTMPRPRPATIVYRAAALSLIWHNRLGAACDHAAAMLRMAQGARDLRDVTRRRLDRAQEALAAAAPVQGSG